MHCGVNHKEILKQGEKQQKCIFHGNLQLNYCMIHLKVWRLSNDSHPPLPLALNLPPRPPSPYVLTVRHWGMAYLQVSYQHTKGSLLLADDISKFHFTSEGSRLQIQDVPKSGFFNFSAKPSFNNIWPLNFTEEQYSSTMAPVFIFFGAISIWASICPSLWSYLRAYYVALITMIQPLWCIFESATAQMQYFKMLNCLKPNPRLPMCSLISMQIPK